MNEKTQEVLNKIDEEVTKVYETYRYKSLESINQSKKEFLVIKETYNQNMQKNKIGELTTLTESQLKKYKSQYIQETRKLLDTFEQSREKELSKAPSSSEDKILAQLEKLALQKEYEFKYGVMEGNQIQQELPNIDNELEFNTAKYIAYNKLDDKSTISQYRYTDKVLDSITGHRNYLKLLEVQEGIYLVNGQVEYLITGKDQSDYFFSK